MMKPEMTKKTSTPAAHGRCRAAAKDSPAPVASACASACACKAATESAARPRSAWTRMSFDTAPSGRLEKILDVAAPRHRRDGAVSESRERGGGVGVGGGAERV